MYSKGIQAKWTRGRGSFKLVYTEMLDLKEDTMKREYQIKKLTRQEKLLLINPNWYSIKSIANNTM